MKSKIVFLTALLLSSFLKSGFSENLWMRISSPVSTALFNCTFPDSLNGWAAGEDGVIIHTSNSGISWVIQNNPVNYYINDIYFINKRIGWAVSNEFLNEGSTLLRTSNGGINWIAENFQDTTVFLKTVYFPDSLNGFLGGFGGKIFKTTNSGNTWLPTITDSSSFSFFPITKIRFLSPQLGIACGGILDIAGIIWKSTNSGNSWIAENQSPEPFYGLHLKDSLNFFAVGGDFEYGAQIVRSSNMGTNWTYFSLGLFGQCQAVDFRTDKEAWMPLGFSETWAVSFDGGDNWVSSPVTDNVILNSVDFSDSLHGWAVGNNGAILKYVGNKVNIINEATNVPGNFNLQQNFPNPFNPSTKIGYSFKGNKFISIKIYDMLGNEIRALINKHQISADEKEIRYVDFPAGELNLPTGIYFYSLYVDYKFIEAKKMIYLK